MQLAKIVEKLGGTLVGDGSLDIKGLGSLADAQVGDLSFLANPRYTSAVASTLASAVLLAKDWKGECPCAAVYVENPDRAFAEAALLLSPPPVGFAPGVHPTAVIAPDAKLGEGVTIGPHVVIQPGAVVGDRSVLVANCYVGHEAVIGSDCRLYAHVSIRERCVLGNRVIIHDGSVVGSDGFGYTPDKHGVWHKVLQLGIVEVGDDVEIGANAAIDRARFGKTRVGNGVKIDNLVQIAHNVQIGDHAVMASQVGISGSTWIGRHVQLGGQAGLAGHLHVGDGAVVGAQAGVTKDVEAGSFVSGYPAMDHRKATKAHAHLMRLPELKERIKKLEDLVTALQQREDKA
ncbi:MAG TPA: UDP-3-O-(3-hydroxymyristoyl)glucosamine N-acyltransferase [Verrucomicrobia bacterium]|nr:UDP-3-O-(3-hydroxymyristoyl)glucosamine N-acyltransferase [Verrucomicrobiota bacterium]